MGVPFVVGRIVQVPMHDPPLPPFYAVWVHGLSLFSRIGMGVSLESGRVGGVLRVFPGSLGGVLVLGSYCFAWVGLRPYEWDKLFLSN